jgi:energy-coupling factor transporter ATP-binding protein EcfA2
MKATSLWVDDLSYRYPQGEGALHHISFRVNPGERVGIIGLNGSGKSTLLHHLNGLLLPTSGRVQVGDVTVEKSTLRLVRQRVGLVFQQAEEMLFSATLYEDVAFGLRIMGLPEAEVASRVMEHLSDVGLWEERHRSGATLSVGQCRSAAIATVLAMHPSVLLLDEPTAGLDARMCRHVVRQVTDCCHTCLIASHDLNFLRAVTQRTLVLENGYLVRDDSTRNILGDEGFLRAYDLV